MTDVEALASEAAGESVTAERLRGDEQYFPDCRPHLQAGQQPHHLVLLTTSGNAASGHLEDEFVARWTLTLGASDGGVAVVTEDALLVVVDDDVVEMPCATIHALVRDGRTLEVHAGGLRYKFNVARSADDGEVAAGFAELRRLVRAETA